MLLALPIIGVTSSSVTGLEEKMAANNKDINLAFQAAEAALRAAETSLKTQPESTKNNVNRAATIASQGSGGYYTLLSNVDATTGVSTLISPVPSFYSSVDWNPAATSKKYITFDNGTTVKKLAGLYYPPEYIIEEIGSEGAEGDSGGSLEGGAVQVASAGLVITFRITAHGWGSNENSIANVQSVVKVTYH
jgi:type IV pilus assembly protein PilX